MLVFRREKLFCLIAQYVIVISGDEVIVVVGVKLKE